MGSAARLKTKVVEMTLNRKKIGLGTVQFGLDYGVSNSTGQVSEQEVRKILRLAWDSGIRILDTAAAYGMSEEVLGKTIEPDCQFQVVTKVPKIGFPPAPDAVASFIRETFEKSLRKLRRESVYALMFHNADDLLAETGKEAYATLQALKQAGLIEKIGVSAYTQAQLDAVTERFQCDLVQVPVNVLDQRLVRSGSLADLHAKGIEIHARSVFLQGLILMNPEELEPFFDPIRPILREFHNLAGRLETSPLKLALTYIGQLDMISTFAIGVTCVAELREILDAFREPVSAEFDQFAVSDEAIVNPVFWKK